MVETVDTSIAVVGGSAGSIAAAVRAAREGHETVLVSYNDHLGGMMAGGLSYTDTLTMKNRSPLLEEFVAEVRDYYRSEYGADSEQFEYCENGYIFEPHVAESILTAFVEEEDGLTWKSGYHPTDATRTADRIESVTFESFDDESEFVVQADAFVEGTYEGDLMAVSGAPWRLGREARSEFDEQFAGRLFTQARGDRYYPRAAVGNEDDSAPADRRGPLDVPDDKQVGELDLIPHPAGLTEIFPKSTGTGDDAIQAYNYRLCLSRDPENRRYPEKPRGYDREEYVSELEEIEEGGLRPYLLLRYLPNEKADMNSADLPGENHDYPTADWERRHEIADRHRRYALGLLYFLQNDDDVPDEIQSKALEWGLAEDEFTDNDNFPWQFYVREARRLEGQYTFSEADARHAEGLDRTPVHGDSIAIAEYPLDSHACTAERQPGSQPDGFFYASQVTRPAQVPYRTMLPRGLSNLIVPIPLSATHVAFGTIRLEPTWIHIGEAAGCAAAQSLEEGVRFDELDVSSLQRRLVECGSMLTFFNELDMGTEAEWTAAVQFFGTKGFFGSYNARPESHLSSDVGRIWARNLAALHSSTPIEFTSAAREVYTADDSSPIAGREFEEQLATEFSHQDVVPAMSVPEARADADIDPDAEITRGEACSLMYRLL